MKKEKIKTKLNIISYIINWIECYKMELITKKFIKFRKKINYLYSFIKQIFLDSLSNSNIKKNRN